MSTFVARLGIVSGIGGFLFGYDTGVINGALFQIEDKFDFSSDSWKAGLVVSLAVGGAFIGSLMGGPIIQYQGRRGGIMISDLIFTAAAAVMALANTFEMLCAGRFLAGLGVGIASTGVPIYISECSPREIRGKMVTLYVLMITFGQFVASGVSAVIVWKGFAGEDGWRWMLGLSAAPALLQLVGMVFMPKSPQFLLMRERKSSAENILTKIYMDSPNPAIEVRKAMESTDTHNVHASWTELFQPGIRIALVIGCGLQFFQQFCGINSVMYYSSTILKSEGIDAQDAIYWSCPIAFLNFLFTFPGLYMIDRSGRKWLAICSLIGCLISCMVMAVGEWVHITNLSLVSLGLYIMTFAFGMGPVPWTVNSEIYPLRLRSMGSSFAASVNWMSNIVVSQCFPIFMGVIGTGTTFLGLAGFCLAAIIFVCMCVPETKGLSFAEIAVLLRSGKYAPLLKSPPMV